MLYKSLKKERNHTTSIVHLHASLKPKQPAAVLTGVSLTLSMFVRVLEGLDQAQSLIHRATHGQVIDCDLPQDALVINDKQTPEKAQIKI